MSEKKRGIAAGTYLGGIRTLEDIRIRCRIDEETGCWNWSMGTVDGTVPKITWVDAEGKRVQGRGRRMAWLVSGKTLPNGWQVFAKKCCESDACVNPEHSKSGTLAAARAANAAKGWLSKNPAKLAAIAKATDARRKLSPEAVAEIRASELSNNKIGEKFGVSGFAVWCVRKGLTHRQKGYSVFSPGAL